MKTHIITAAILSFLTAAAFAQAGSYVVTPNNGAVVRKGPDTTSPVITFRGKNAVVVGNQEGMWVKLELPGGTTGYISSKVLRPQAETDIPPAAKAAPGNKVNEITDAVPPKQESIRSLIIIPPPPSEKEAPRKPDQSLQEENNRLKAENAKLTSDIKAVQRALAATEAKLRASDHDLKKADTPLTPFGVQSQSVQKHNPPAQRDTSHEDMLGLADIGKPIFFKGVGEALMSAATSDDRRILRFPIKKASKADEILAAANPERYNRGSFVYYILANKTLGF